MDKSALYRIRVRGQIPDNWCDRLGGLQISAETSNNVALEEWLPDQAALAGVLDAFYTLRGGGRPRALLRVKEGDQANQKSKFLPVSVSQGFQSFEPKTSTRKEKHHGVTRKRQS